MLQNRHAARLPASYQVVELFDPPPFAMLLGSKGDSRHAEATDRNDVDCRGGPHGGLLAFAHGLPTGMHSGSNLLWRRRDVRPTGCGNDHRPRRDVAANRAWPGNLYHSGHALAGTASKVKTRPNPSIARSCQATGQGLLAVDLRTPRPTTLVRPGFTPIIGASHSHCRRGLFPMATGPRPASAADGVLD